MTAHQLGEIDTAVAHYERRARDRQGLLPGTVQSGPGLPTTGRHRRAKARYLEAMQARPDHPEVHCNLGVLAFGQGHYHDAVTLSAPRPPSPRPTSTTPPSTSSTSVGARAPRRMADAQRAYDRCIDLDPQHFGARYNLGTLHLERIKNPKQAERSTCSKHTTSIRNDPNHSSISPCCRTTRCRTPKSGTTRRSRPPTSTIRTCSRACCGCAHASSNVIPPVANRTCVVTSPRSSRSTRLSRCERPARLHYEAMGATMTRGLPRARSLRENFDDTPTIDLECLYLLAKLHYDNKQDDAKALQLRDQVLHGYNPDSKKAADLKRRTVRIPQDIMPLRSRTSTPWRPAPIPAAQ